jgi:hypothetical protein
VELRTEIVPFEVGEDVSYDESPEHRLSERGDTRHVGHFGEQRPGRREQPVEVPVHRVEDGLDVGHAAVARHHEIRPVARRAPDRVEEPPALLGVGVLFARRRLEVIEQVELEAPRDAVQCLVGEIVGRRRLAPREVMNEPVADVEVALAARVRPSSSHARKR